MNCKVGDLAVIVAPALGLPTDANIGRFVKITASLGMLRHEGFGDVLFAWHVVALGVPLVSPSGTLKTGGRCPDIYLRPIRGETQTEMMLDAAHV